MSEVSLELPVIRLVHRKTGRRVTFLSMMHIGEREYYAACNRILADHNGVVLFEGVGGVSSEDRKMLTDGQLLIVQDLDGLTALQAEIAEIMGLVTQREMITPDQGTWTHADIESLELIRRWERECVPLLEIRRARKMLDALRKHESKSDSKESTVKTLRSQVWVMMRGRIVSVLPDSIQSLLLDHRNDKALAAFDTVPEDQDALFIYGAAHGEGIIKGLVRRGFREESRHSLKVFSVEKNLITNLSVLFKPLNRLGAALFRARARVMTERIRKEGYVAVYGRPDRFDVPTFLRGLEEGDGKKN